MNRIVKYIIFYSLVIGLLKSESVNNDIHSLHPVKLDVYDGDGSLLLHWAIPDTIKQNLVSIYRKSAQEKKFSLLTKIDNSSDRFLDLDVESSERYFYFVKILDDKNNIIKSDNIRPEFGTCLVESVIEKNGEIFSIWDLMSKIVSKSFSYHYPDIGKEIFSAIINILSLNDVHKNSWIEDFPINYLDNVEFIINKPSNLVFNDDIINDFKLLESKYRNYFKLTPKEWSKEIEKVYNETANKWSKLVDSFDSWDHYRSADSESSREMMYNICKANSQYASNSDVGEELCQDEVNSYVSNYAFYFALSIVKLIAVLLIGYGFLNLKEYLHIKEIEFKQSLRPSPSTSGQISPDGFEWLSLDDGTKWYRRANSGDQYQKSS